MPRALNIPCVLTLYYQNVTLKKEVEVSIGEGENKTSLDGSKCPISMTKNAQVSMAAGKAKVKLTIVDESSEEES